MGTLAGHLLPGSFFFLIGAFWSIITAFRYAHSKSNSTSIKKQHGYKTSVTMPCLCLPCAKLRRFPIESFLKLIMGFLGILGEYVTGNYYYYVEPTKKDSLIATTHPAHDHDHIHKRALSDERIKVWAFHDGNIQHITMYSAFVLGAFIEILMYYRFNVPKKLDFVGGLIGFGTEAFLFYFHLHAREPVDVHIHTLLVYTVYGCILFIILEMNNSHQVLFTYGRILFTILQGTWFCQIGFVLYPPFDSPAFKWDLNNHDQMMILTASFCWHIFFIFIGLLIQSWIIQFVYNCSKDNYSQTMDDLIEIELQTNTAMEIDYKKLYNPTSKRLDLNSQDEMDSNDELITFKMQNA